MTSSTGKVCGQSKDLCTYSVSQITRKQTWKLENFLGVIARPAKLIRLKRRFFIQRGPKVWGHYILCSFWTPQPLAKSDDSCKPSTIWSWPTKPLGMSQNACLVFKCLHKCLVGLRSIDSAGQSMTVGNVWSSLVFSPKLWGLFIQRNDVSVNRVAFLSGLSLIYWSSDGGGLIVLWIQPIQFL